MRGLAGVVVLLLAVPEAADAQSTADRRFGAAPWWMDQPITASIGYVQTEIAANRANFSAGFKALDANPQAASRKAADKVREMVQALAAYGPEKVRVTTAIFVSPIYQQYRDKDGNLIANQRADKIDTYEATATVSLEVRDLGLLEKAHAMVLAAGPTSTQAVNFNLEPGNDQKTKLFADAVADAVTRARLSAEATGVRLGPVKLIDPTGRACQTDVLLAGAPNTHDNSYASDVPAPPPPPMAAPMVTMTARRMSAKAAEQEDAMQLALQPPMEQLQARACVVFTLGEREGAISRGASK